ncbi:MAG: AAA family ATPase [Deltaproteobacteria bacterium]|nr:AAA family ATPase [Deltaproteobacteria bacterium]MBW2640225.1 AAA family ATPase [Deltaproteobacteria bacterium]MBW2681166.1 AAA family ATPase [Deltaproteobacteria bacterium]
MVNIINSFEMSKQRKQKFNPPVPENLDKTGLSEKLVEDLIFKLLLSRGVLTGRQIAVEICLHFKIIEPILSNLKKQLFLTYRSDAGINDFAYMLTEQGRTKANVAVESSAYIGAAPVPFAEYLKSVQSQSIQKENPGLEELQHAFHDLVLEPHIFFTLGPAINSGRGVFLYGAPGNGKTSIAKRIHKCFNDAIYIPKTLLISGDLLKFYDPQWHKSSDEKGLNYDRRWIKIERPAVIVGGEMDLDSLGIKYNPQTKISEAPLQMKANCGTFVVDDFGRQRVNPIDLLNRWILPLEKRIDFLTLSNGIKFQVPFDELLIFCTNIDPKELLDEAFLRRIPYKVKLEDPSEEKFRQIMKFVAPKYNIEYHDEMIDYLISNYFRGKRPFRSCHPRDILEQIVNASAYQRIQPKLTKDLIKLAAFNYFAAMEQSNKKE